MIFVFVYLIIKQIGYTALHYGCMHLKGDLVSLIVEYLSYFDNEQKEKLVMAVDENVCLLYV